MNYSRCFSVCVIIVSLAVSSPVSAGDLHAWVDEQGVQHITDTPPPPQKTKRVIGSTSSREMALKEKQKEEIARKYEKIKGGINDRYEEVARKNAERQNEWNEERRKRAEIRLERLNERRDDLKDKRFRAKRASMHDFYDDQIRLVESMIKTEEVIINKRNY